VEADKSKAANLRMDIIMKTPKKHSEKETPKTQI